MIKTHVCMSFRLASAAASLARQLQGIATARACGDWQYVDSWSEGVTIQEHYLAELKRQATQQEIAEARDITNAPI